ncbi:membrane-spanning protein [Bacillus sp. MUM 116]|uniref:membrane-spanning protein n=1 Tax=Bacillus sp. MUM 116 TaxID=1678002 RepID=UPI0008F5D3AA|nr:membrane-spanning protein [Bacillus sp. MUM 116]OIK10938.1 membrane-spanning protein [Bacillus sp. MUM 116]
MKRKIIIFLSVAFMVFMAVLFVFYLIKGDTSKWQVALGGILVSALPLLLLRLKNNPFNISQILGYFLFLFCTTYLGSIALFYIHHKWWDSSLHFYKGVYIGFIAITLFKELLTSQVREGMSRWVLFLFVLSFGSLVSVLWEIYEFIGDLTFTHTMQRGGNTDTMYDLLFGFLGGLLIALYSLVRKQQV